jgi:hypothetical protein
LNLPETFGTWWPPGAILLKMRKNGNWWPPCDKTHDLNAKKHLLATRSHFTERQE